MPLWGVNPSAPGSLTTRPRIWRAGRGLELVTSPRSSLVSAQPKGSWFLWGRGLHYLYPQWASLPHFSYPYSSWVLRLGETLALPRRAEYLQTSGLIRQVRSNWRGSPSAVPWEPFQLNADNSGRLLRGGRSGIRASRKLGRRNCLGRAHRFGGCWGRGPRLALPIPLQLNLPPWYLFLLTSSFPQHHSALGQALPQQALATRSGNKALEQPGAEPRGVSAPRSEREEWPFALTLRA